MSLGTHYNKTKYDLLQDLKGYLYIFMTDNQTWIDFSPFTRAQGLRFRCCQWTLSQNISGEQYGKILPVGLSRNNYIFSIMQQWQCIYIYVNHLHISLVKASRLANHWLSNWLILKTDQDHRKSHFLSLIHLKALLTLSILRAPYWVLWDLKRESLIQVTYV